MMSGILTSLLADYSPPQDKASGLAIFKQVKSEPKPDPDTPPSSVDHNAEQIRDAVAKARAEERVLANKELRQTLAAERKRFEEELQAQRVIWTEQEGGQLSYQFTEAFSNFERIISDKVATILSSFVSEALRQQTIADFENALAVMLSGTSSRFIRVSGPEDILSAIEERIGARAGAIEFVPSDDVEVKVVSEDTTIETQLQSWSCRLSDVMKAV